MPQYTTCIRLLHDGKTIPPGESVTLTAKQAEPLLMLNAIEADATTEPEPTPEPEVKPSTTRTKPKATKTKEPDATANG